MTAPRLAAQAVSLLEQAGCAIHYMEPYPPPADIARLVAAVQADAVLTRQGRVDAAVLAASPRLIIVARHGVGVDDVDVAAAAARGVMVTRAPGSNTRAVAEHTLAFILALAKDLRPLGQTIAAGKWRGGATMVRDIAGLRLGLVGLGAIGRDVAALAGPLGMRVAAFTPNATPVDGLALAPDLGALLAGSEVISLHCPYSARTHHLLDAAALAAMPAGGFVVNTARGGLIDEAALLAALDSGHIEGAALDVFEVEPPDMADALRSHPRVLATPHVAGVTASSLVNMGVMAAECIVAALTAGTVPPDRIVRPT
jgi:D-3-phosphoglycerate dehydrogenase